MVSAFENASKLDEPVIVHVCTKKGKGYPPAEKNPSRFHGVAPFFVSDGSDRGSDNDSLTYTEVFSEKMVELAAEDDTITAVSAAMPTGTGLAAMAEAYPDRFFDVGIAEEHAVTFAAGMAAGGLRPVIAIYSTFLQRAYDQILHDVCINNLPVVFAIDRAGIVGSDGETHQGIFDISFLMHMPNMTIMAPKNADELCSMMSFAVEHNGPVAIRYPRGNAYTGLSENTDEIVYGKGEWIREGMKVALVAAGSMAETAVEVADMLLDHDMDVSVINIRFIKPFDTQLLDELKKAHTHIVTLEEGVLTGGFGHAVEDYYKNDDVEVCCVGLPDKFIEHGSVDILKKKYRIDAESITEMILDRLSGK